MCQAERVADPAHQRLKDLVRPQGRGHLLEDVEEQFSRPQRVLGIDELRPAAQVGIDAGPQLAEMHRTLHRVERAGLERVGDRVRPAVRQEHHQRRSGEARPGRQIPNDIGQRDFLRGGAQNEEIGGLRRTVGAERGVRRFGHLEAPADQKPLQPIGSRRGVADEENSMLGLFRQRASARKEACQAIVHTMERQQSGDARVGA